MATSPQIKIDAFNSSKISLELWLSLLEANFSNLGITEDTKKKNVLLVSLGTDVFGILGNLCAPDLPHTKTYECLLNLLKSHYIVTPSYHRSLVGFQQRKKKNDESVHSLYVDLKALAKDCKFGDQFDARVRDQLFMAVDQEIYFPNLVALNIDLQSMTSQAVLERILNMEKAFVSEKGEAQPQVKLVKNEIKSCKHCGYPHDSRFCRFKNLTCHNCKQRGHLKKMCSETSRPKEFPGERYSEKGKVKAASFKSKSRKSIKVLDEEVNSEDLSDCEDRLLTVKEKVFALNTDEFYFKIQQQSVPFEIDSGAAVSTMTKEWVQELNLDMESCNKKLKAYDNREVEVLGKVVVPVQYNNTNVSQVFYIVDSHNTNLCGKDLMKQVGIYLAGINENTRVNKISNLSAKQMLINYSVDSSRSISGVLAKVHVRDNATPKFLKARTVPFYYKKMIEDALDKLVSDEMIEPISHSEWAVPIVPVLKENKREVRLCGDFKVVNKQIHCDRYPLPKIEELLSVVGRGKVFSKIDLKNAYLQIPVDEQSRECLVINTHKGLFKYKRLPFGLSSSPGIFQRFISQLLANVEGVAAYLDDIIVSGENQEEHDKRLKQVLELLEAHNVQINKNKTVLNAHSIEYLGYHISGEGIRPSSRRLEAILECPCPTSVEEVQSFLGMITYYCKFIRDFSSKLAPLYDLLKKGVKFQWGSAHQKAFEGIKRDFANSTLLTNFDGESPLILEVDASPVGVGCVLLQNLNGQERPIYFASKKLSKAELNYSQLDKEGLALVYAVKRFRYFLLGRTFVARTDHKPLLGLFGREKQIPCNANARIQRWALLLSQYDYDLLHKPGKENVIADALSRLPLADDFCSGTPAEYVNLVELLDFNDISFQSIQRLTNKDATLSQLKSCLKLGWSNEYNITLMDYSAVKDDLSLHNGVILYRNRVLIPGELRCKVLDHLHGGHNGINAMKAEARKWVWWPKMDQDIGEITKNCSICFKNFKNSQAPPLSWPDVGKPWSRLHIDYAGPIDNKYFLVIMDSHSKFLDVQFSNSATSTVTISHLRKTFCNFGIPDVIVSDNAPNLVSSEMEDFLHKNGIKHVTPAPYHPSSNGLAERAVRTFKEGLGKFTKGDIQTRVCRFLYNYRRSVHSLTGKTPAEIMFNRNFKGTVEAVRLEDKSVSNMNAEIGKKEEPLFSVNDAVFVRNFGKGPTWVEGKVVEVLGLRNYKVEVQSFGNIIWKRHADQIMHRYIGDFNHFGKELWEGPREPLRGNLSLSLPNSCPPMAEPAINLNDSNTTLEQPREEAVDRDNDFPVQPNELRRSARRGKPPDRLNL